MNTYGLRTTGLFSLHETRIPFLGSFEWDGCFLVVLSLPLPDLHPLAPEEHVLPLQDCSSIPLGLPKLELELLVPTTVLGTQGLVLIRLLCLGDGEALKAKPAAIGAKLLDDSSTIIGAGTDTLARDGLPTSQDSDRLCPWGKHLCNQKRTIGERTCPLGRDYATDDGVDRFQLTGGGLKWSSNHCHA